MRAPAIPRTTALAALVCLGLLAPACNRSAAIRAQALKDSTPITFPTSEGVVLAGRLFGPADARTGVVLAHMLGADQSTWYDFADRLGQQGYRVLTFDFRGYCPGGDAGCSQGTRSMGTNATDVEAAVRRLRQEGVLKVALVGASMGGTADLVAASTLGEKIPAVVTLSAPVSIGGLTADTATLQTVTAAKLYIAGNGDAPAAASAQALYDDSQPPKRLEILTTADHGTDILDGGQGEIAANLILDWLQRYAPA